jgi:insertion element IS1 protein InsB
LIQRLRAWDARLYCADAYDVDTDLIPVGRLYQGKDQTHGVERTNAQQRHWLARFRRRTCVVSKTVRMVELFARFCVNGTPDNLLSIAA